MSSLPFEVVRNPRSRRARLRCDPVSGRILLTLPPRAPLAPALRWAEGHGDWIARQRARLPEARPFVPGAAIPLGDDTLTLRWEPSASRRVTRDADAIVTGGPEETVARRVAAWLKREALALLSDETAEFARLAGVRVSGVSVGDPRGRWGSCAHDGAIRYSWRLLLAPTHVRRATVAHEVAHRLHMDHSRAFHAAVRRLLGHDADPARRWLRAHGAQLHWYGRES